MSIQSFTQKNFLQELQLTPQTASSEKKTVPERAREFFEKKDTIYHLLQLFSFSFSSEEKAKYVQEIRDLCSTLRDSSAPMDATIREHEIKEILDQITSTLTDPTILQEKSDEALLPLLSAIISWMVSNERSELPHFLTQCKIFFTKTQSSKTFKHFLDILNERKKFPKDTSAAYRSISIDLPHLSSALQKFAEKYWASIVENFQAPSPITFETLSSLTVSLQIHSHLNTLDRVSLMKTCTRWKQAGEAFMQKSTDDAACYILHRCILPTHQFSMDIIPSAFKKNFFIAIFSLIQNIQNFEKLPFELQEDPLLLKIVALSYALKGEDEKALSFISHLPKNVQQNTVTWLKTVKKTPLPQSKFWQKLAPFLLAGCSDLPRIIALFSIQHDKTDCFFPEHLQHDPEYRSLLFDIFKSKLFFTNPFLATDESFFKECVRRDGTVLRYGSISQRSDFSLALSAVQQNGFAFAYVHDSLKDNEQIILGALKGYKGLQCFPAQKIFPLISDHLFKNKDFITKTVAIDGSAIYWSPKEFITPALITSALKTYPPAFTLSSEDLKADPHFVLNVVKQHGYLLKKASPLLQDDPNIVLEAVKNNFKALAYASLRLKSDRNFVLAVVKLHGFALQYAEISLLEDKEIVEEAMKSTPDAFRFAGSGLKKDRNFVLAAVKKSGHLLQYADEKLQADPEITKEAYLQNKRSLLFASDRLKAH